MYLKDIMEEMFIKMCIVTFLFVSGHLIGFVKISIPKCGSFLALKAMDSIIDDPRYKISYPKSWFLLDDNIIRDVVTRLILLHTHAIYIPENIKKITQNGIKVIFIYRDPRDQLVSAAFWIQKISCNPYSKWSIDRIIDELIFGGGFIWSQIFLAQDPWQHLTSIVDFYNLYLPWMFEPNVYVTTFEKLVGPKGGGTEKDQLHEIMAMANHIGKELSSDGAKNVANQLFGGTSTFREGKIGSWKKHLLSRHIKALKQLPGFNELLFELGYEKDGNWGS